uniref:Uncharacterized protein n=1 Tax=Romanomermis culicivorax TaxID=13658 RepID=A0A915KHT3_ROMCU
MAVIGYGNPERFGVNGNAAAGRQVAVSTGQVKKTGDENMQILLDKRRTQLTIEKYNNNRRVANSFVAKQIFLII